MKIAFPISPQQTSPRREALVFAGSTIVLTWLFWTPAAFLPMGSGIGDFFVALGSLVPLAVALLLQIRLHEWTFAPRQWLTTLTARNIALALFTGIAIFAPILLLRVFQGTLNPGHFLNDGLRNWTALIGLIIFALAEECGWRAYFLPRFQNISLYLTNAVVGVLWFVWQLPLVLAGRYNTSENFSGFVFAMFLYALLLTPFLNRLALRGNYNPILCAILRALSSFVIAIYFLQGRGDPLTDTFGNLAIGWLVLLNLILFSQLWQGKKPPAEISELERVMPLQGG